MNAWLKTINTLVLHKAIHLCSIHSMKDYFDEGWELKWFLLSDKLKYLLKPDTFPSYLHIETLVIKQGYAV